MNDEFKSSIDILAERVAEARALELFNIDMLIVRGLSGDDAGRSLSNVSARTSSIADLIAKERENRDEFATNITLLMDQIRRLQGELDVLDVEIEELDRQIADIDGGIEQLKAGKDVGAVLSGDQSLEEALDSYEKRTGRTVDRGNADAVIFALEDERQELAQEREDKAERRSEVKRELDGLDPDGDLRNEGAEIVFGLAERDGDFAANSIIERAGYSSEVTEAFSEEFGMTTAHTDETTAAMRETETFSARSDFMDGFDLGIGGPETVSVANAIETSPINAEPVRMAFNAEAEGQEKPQHDVEPENSQTRELLPEIKVV
jgi:hypothetical protein